MEGHWKAAPTEIEPPATHPVSRKASSAARKLWRITTVALLCSVLYVGRKWAYGPNQVLQAHQDGLDGKLTCQSTAGPDFSWSALEPSEDIKWTPCYDGHKCARLSLPLDYLSPEGVGPRANIALRMVPATDKKNYKGAILVNPGGPGGSGTFFVGLAGQSISTIVGPEFDIIGFDPRGTGASTPGSQCFDSNAQFEIWFMQQSGAQTTLLNNSDSSIPLTRSRERVVAERCLQAIGGNGYEAANGTAEDWGPGRFMSTASVATDMLRITEKLGQDKLQYWGFSYGTVLGQYFAAMYPDKVGRLIIDGVYEAYDYRNAQWLTNVEDSDAVLYSFFDFCHKAGEDKCKLYAPSPERIQWRVEQIFDNVYRSPIPVPFTPTGPTLVTKDMLHALMFLATYAPVAVFGRLADALVAAESRDATALSEIVAAIQPVFKCSCEEPAPWQAANEAMYAIACGDSIAPTRKPEAFGEFFANLTALSRFAAPIWGWNHLKCEQWQIRAKWRYTGPFSSTTSHPLLIISPTFDPVCPLSHAKAVQQRYPGAGLLIQNSYGHCSAAAPSLCTAKAVRMYFATGNLPEAGTVCEVEELPFIGRVDNNSLSREDEELFEALKDLGRGLLVD